MLSFSKIKNSADATHYYEKDDYYAKDDPKHKELSQWYGKAAKLLDLEGEVDSKQFHKILDGLLPNGKQLGTKTDSKTIHDAGRDLTFSAPKSISIMALIYNDKRLIKAHEESVKTALDYVEENLFSTRIKVNGKIEKVKTDNLVSALFRHNLSRNADPQLHTHSVVANVTFNPEGETRCAFFDDIYDNKKLIGSIYRSELAYNARKLGYKIEKSGKDSFFELKEVPKKLLKEFSSRSEDIKNHAKENATQKELEQSALKTRKSKESNKSYQNQWLQKIANIMGKDFTINIPKAVRIEEKFAFEAKEAVRHGIEHLSERKTVFPKQELVKTALNDLLSKARNKDITKRIDQLIEKGELLLPKRDDLSETCLTTSSLLEKENYIVNIAREGQDQHQSIIKAEKLAKPKYQKYLTSLNQGQKEAVNLILTSKDRVTLIQGSAGTGKTYMLKVANEIAKKRGYKLMGLAPTGVATVNLKEGDAKIDAITLQRSLCEYDGVAKGRGTIQGRKLMQSDFRNKVVVVDEASMISTNQMKDLLTISKELNFKLILLGDHQQLDSVEAGTPFYELQRSGQMNAIKTAKMTEIIRQNDPNLKEAVEHTIDRKIAEAFKKIDLSIVQASGKGATVDETIKIFCKLKEEERKSTMILTPANEDRQAVNGAISQILFEERNKNPLLCPDDKSEIYENKM